MIDERSLLERAASKVPAPDGVVEGLVRRRDRRHRNRRVGAAMVAAVVGVAAIVSARVLLEIGTGETPAGGTARITPADVGRLRIAWTATVGDGPIEALAANDDTVYAAGPWGKDGWTLQAFPIACDAEDGVCRPLWIASLPGPASIAAGDGSVYAASGHLLRAFDGAGCHYPGGGCDPSWTGEIGIDATAGGIFWLTVAHGSVYVANGDERHGQVTAFREHCSPATDGRCPFTWTSEVLPHPLALGAVIRQRLYAGVSPISESVRGVDELYAFHADCPMHVRSCAPASHGRIEGPAFAGAPATDGRVIYVGTAMSPEEGTLRAYDASCAVEPDCEPIWVVPTDDGLNIPRPVTDGDVVVTASRFSGRIRAYPAGTGKPPELLWTACCPLDIIDADPIVRDGLVWVASSDGISTYPTACGTGNAFCRPAWTSSGQAEPQVLDENPPVSSLQVSGGAAITGTTTGDVVAYKPTADEVHPMTARERTFTAMFYGAMVVGIGVALLVRSRRRRRA